MAKAVGLSLFGLRIVVTRPAHQAQELCEKIESLGGFPIPYPVLGIESPEEAGPVVEIIQRLNEFDIAIFISANAVDRAINLIEQHGQYKNGCIPGNLQIAAVGKASAKALKRQGYLPHIVPDKIFNSEALLSLPELQNLSGKKVVIFRGEGGREKLATVLAQRGADVSYAECYRRVRPDSDDALLMHHWARGEIDIITVTSNEAMRNLYDMVGKVGQHWLQTTPIIGVSVRMTELTRQLGIKAAPIIAKAASDDAIVDAIIYWQSERN